MNKLIYIAAENETVRRNNTTPENVTIATYGLVNCLGVIIMDNEGNQSITHVDAGTDLNFISREIAHMSGEFTIDLIKYTDNTRNGLSPKVIKYLTDNNLVKTLNRKNEVCTNVRNSTHGTVWIDEKLKVLSPTLVDLHNIANNIPAKNKRLNSYAGKQGAKSHGHQQINVYVRQLNYTMQPFGEDTLPTVIYDGNDYRPYDAKLTTLTYNRIAGIDWKNPNAQLQQCMPLPENLMPIGMSYRSPKELNQIVKLSTANYVLPKLAAYLERYNINRAELNPVNAGPQP